MIRIKSAVNIQKSIELPLSNLSLAEALERGDEIMTIKLKIITIVLTLVNLFASSALSAKNHSHQDIQNTAINFVRAQLPDDVIVKEISTGKIDSRIHFKQCSIELEARSSNNRPLAKHQTIGVYCYGDTPWNIYISVKSKLLRKMLVTRSTIVRGEIITAAKLQLIEQEIKNKKYLSNINDALGYEARRTIRPNQVINSAMLQKALLVRKRELVTIYAQNKNLRISMSGTALNSGHKNEMIKVRNDSSQKIIEAMVIDRGIVAINF